MAALIVLIVLLVLGIFGRLACGILCPVGILQELLYKIPFFKKRRNLPHDEVLRNVKYVVLVFVIISIILDFTMPGLTEGKINSLVIKIGGFSLVFILSLFTFRPFCKYFCPFGVVLGLFNKISPFRYKVKNDKCIKCNICTRECKMDIVPYTDIDSIECIKCGKCLRKCPKQAIDAKVFAKEISMKKKEIKNKPKK